MGSVTQISNPEWAQAGDEAQQRLMQRRQQAEQQRIQQQNTVGAQLLDAINNASNIKPQTKDENGNIIHNPEYDNAQTAKQKLLEQYTTLMSPAQHANFAQHLHGLIFGHADHRPQQPALSPNSSPNEPSQPAAQGQVPAPASPAPLHPGAALTQPAPPDHPIHAITKGIKELGNHLSAFAHPLPPQPQPDTALMAKYYKDPEQVKAERAQELANIHGQYTVEAAKARGQNVRPVANNPGAVALDDARKLRDSGQEFLGRDGEPIDLDSLKDAGVPLKLVPVLSPGGNYWMVANQKDRLQVVGNQLVTLPETGSTTPEQMSALGTKNLGSESTHQVPGMNPGEVVTLTSTRTPTTGSVPTAGTPPTTTPVLKTRSDATNPAAPSLPPSPSQAAQVAKANAKRSQSRQIPQPSGAPMPPPFAPGTMLSQGRSAQPVVAAMNTVAAQVFGGNGEKPIWENAWMFDKPELRAALNKALTLNALAIPGTEDDPSFTQTLATAVGATGWSQEQIRQANQQARDNLQRLGGDDAMSMFARMAGLQEDLSALRTATKASAAQGSIRTLVRAAPVYNVASSKNFRDQLGVTLNTAEASMRGYPAINPAYLDWFKRGASAARGGPISQNSPQIHDFAIDDQGKKHKVLDPNAKLPTGWKWAPNGR